MDTNEIPFLTFDELYDKFYDGQIVDETDKQIAEKILDAQRDWTISIQSLNDFLVVLEEEIDGDTTKSNLTKLLKRYNKDVLKYAWKAESVSYLLEIFSMTDKSNLRTIFCELEEKLKPTLNTINDLRKLMTDNGINPNVVEFDKEYPNEAYCIRQLETGAWETYYSERGGKTSCLEFQTEAHACKYLWNEIKTTHNTNYKNRA
ncbi:MAG: hypothetical protein K9J17_11250 [Flavobacteriales bacterium]|nr:hypothetical protein [Flavobacteriales bacterium]